MEAYYPIIISQAVFFIAQVAINRNDMLWVKDSLKRAHQRIDGMQQVKQVYGEKH